MGETDRRGVKNKGEGGSETAQVRWKKDDRGEVKKNQITCAEGQVFDPRHPGRGESRAPRSLGGAGQADWGRARAQRGARGSRPASRPSWGRRAGSRASGTDSRPTARVAARSCGSRPGGLSPAESKVGKVSPKVSPTLLGTQGPISRPRRPVGSRNPFPGRLCRPPARASWDPRGPNSGLMQIPPRADARPRTPASAGLLIAERENAEEGEREREKKKIFSAQFKSHGKGLQL